MPLVYNELKRLAGSYLRRERSDHTLEATALVHEAFLRMVDRPAANWEHRSHFFGIASRMIRQILVDHARAHQAAKRGGGRVALTLNEALGVPGGGQVDLVRLDDALTGLEKLDAQQSRIVELRFFTGLSVEETAAALSISPSAVKRDWTAARAWLFRELQRV